LTLDDRLLEIGFGRGDGLKLVYDKLNEGRGNGCVFGLEASEYMLHLSNKRFTVEIADEGTIVLDCIPNIAHLPYPNDTFDGVFHVDVFYFWNQEAMPQIVRELSRVLKPGGHLICGLELARLKKLEKARVLFGWEYDPMRYTEYLEPTGLTDVSIQYEKISPSREAMIISAKKPPISDEDLDPETKMKKLEQDIKERLALESLISSKRAMSAKLKQKLEENQGL